MKGSENGATWIKLKRIIPKYVSEVKSRNARKYNFLLIKSKTENGIQSNPDNFVWNLSSRNLTNEECLVILYVLNHGIPFNLSCKDVLPSMESVWDQLTRNNLLKENYYSIIN